MWWEIKLFVICVFVEWPVYMHFADTQSRRWSNNTYYCFGATDKYSTKGLSKRHTDIDKDTFLTVLTNRRRMGNIKEFQDREHTISEVSREEMDMEKPWWKH